MKLPGSDHAIVDVRKLRDYCLNDQHPDGVHKARLFRTLLGLNPEDAASLRDILIEIAHSHEAVTSYADRYGQRYRIDFELEWAGRRALVRSAWIVEPEGPGPRLLSCYPLLMKGSS